MIIKTNQGIGDCLYLRPVLKWLPHNDLYLMTPWPQLFHDIPKIKFIRYDTQLRTQRENVQRDDLKWCSQEEDIDIFLEWYDLRHYTIVGYYCQQILGYQPKWFDNSLPVPDAWFEQARQLIDDKNVDNKKICLIRPNTLRNEWLCPARNPKTEYLQRFIDQNRDEFFFIGLANLADGKEFYDGVLKNVDWEITTGVSLETVIGMFCLSSVIITSPSFWSALGLALNSNMLVIHGAHEPHFAINDRRCRATKCTFVEPCPFDICDKEKPDAYKDIDLQILDAAFREVIQRC